MASQTQPLQTSGSAGSTSTVSLSPLPQSANKSRAVSSAFSTGQTVSIFADSASSGSTASTAARVLSRELTPPPSNLSFSPMTATSLYPSFPTSAQPASFSSASGYPSLSSAPVSAYSFAPQPMDPVTRTFADGSGAPRPRLQLPPLPRLSTTFAEPATGSATNTGSSPVVASGSSASVSQTPFRNPSLSASAAVATSTMSMMSAGGLRGPAAASKADVTGTRPSHRSQAPLSYQDTQAVRVQLSRVSSRAQEDDEANHSAKKRLCSSQN